MCMVGLTDLLSALRMHLSEHLEMHMGHGAGGSVSMALWKIGIEAC